MFNDASGATATGAAALAGRAPDASLVADLMRLEAVTVDDHALVEVVAAWKRVEAMAAGRAAQAAAALSRRPSMNPSWPEAAGVVRERCVAGEELALRLGCSRRAAQALVEEGVAFEGILWSTGEALERGEIDDRKARMLLRALREVPGEVALAVEDQVLPRAGRRTHSQVRADIERALVRADPDDAAERADRAAQDRRVCRPTVLPDGMAGLWAVLPAAAALALHSELDALARRVRAAGDGRTLDQLRADALCAAVVGRGRAHDESGSVLPGVRPAQTGACRGPTRPPATRSVICWPARPWRPPCTSPCPWMSCWVWPTAPPSSAATAPSRRPPPRPWPAAGHGVGS